MGLCTLHMSLSPSETHSDGELPTSGHAPGLLISAGVQGLGSELQHHELPRL